MLLSSWTTSCLSAFCPLFWHLFIFLIVRTGSNTFLWKNDTVSTTYFLRDPCNSSNSSASPIQNSRKMGSWPITNISLLSYSPFYTAKQLPSASVLFKETQQLFVGKGHNAELVITFCLFRLQYTSEKFRFLLSSESISLHHNDMNNLPLFSVSAATKPISKERKMKETVAVYKGELTWMESQCQASLF